MIVFISTFVFGILCHGMMLFNKYLTFDDANYFVLVGSTYKSGRWMLGVLESFTHFFLGSYALSLPLFNGTFTILFISISVCLVVKLFDINNKIMGIVLGCVMVSTPVIATMLGYMFCAAYNALGLMLSVIGSYMICDRKKWYSVAIGILLTASSIGVYQAFLPVAISIFLLYFIKEVWNSEESFWRAFLFKSIYYVTSIIIVTLIYLFLNYLFLSLNNIQLTDYQGISSMGQAGISAYLERFVFSYKVFLNPAIGYTGETRLSAFLYPMSARVLYKITLIIICLLSLVCLVLTFRKNKKKAIQLVVLMVFIPGAINFIYVLSNPKIVYSMMLYGQVFIFVYFIWLAKVLAEEINRDTLSLFIKVVGICMIALFSLVYCRFDNVCYLKLDVQQNREISYYTTLVTRIKSANGYKDSFPVTFINEKKLKDNSIKEISELGVAAIPPFNLDTVEALNSYSWKSSMKIWTGYSPKIINSKRFKNMPQVNEMPRYPDDDSIRIINKTVVVKF